MNETQKSIGKTVNRNIILEENDLCYDDLYSTCGADDSMVCESCEDMEFITALSSNSSNLKDSVKVNEITLNKVNIENDNVAERKIFEVNETEHIIEFSFSAEDGPKDEKQSTHDKNLSHLTDMQNKFKDHQQIISPDNDDSSKANENSQEKIQDSMSINPLICKTQTHSFEEKPNRADASKNIFKNVFKTIMDDESADYNKFCEQQINNSTNAMKSETLSYENFKANLRRTKSHEVDITGANRQCQQDGVRKIYEMDLGMFKNYIFIQINAVA